MLNIEVFPLLVVSQLAWRAWILHHDKTAEKYWVFLGNQKGNEMGVDQLGIYFFKFS